MKRRIASLILSAFVLTGGASRAAGLRYVTPADLIAAAHAPSTSVEAWLPSRDPEVLLETVSDGLSQISAIRVRDGAQREIARGKAPIVSADGRWIYFISESGNASEVSVNGGVIRDLGFSVPTAAHLVLDESRHRIYFAKSLHSVTAGASAPGVSVAVIRPVTTSPSSQIVAVDLLTGVARKVGAVAGEVSAMALSSADNSLVVASGYFDSNDSRAMYAGAVVRMNAETGVAEKLMDAAPVAVAPRVRPGSLDVALVATRTGTVFPIFNDVILIEPGHRGRRLTEGLFASQLRWGRKGDLLVTGKSADDPLGSQIYRVTLAGQVSRITSGLFRYSAPTVSPDGETLVATRSDVVGNLDLVELREGQPRIVRRLREAPPQLALGTVERIAYRAPDGARLSGLVIRPPGFDPHRKYPAIVEIHGGPSGGTGFTGQVMVATPLEWHYWADRGYIVFVPEYRGSGVWGYEGVDHWRRAQAIFPRDAEDVLAGVDALTAQGAVEQNRLAVLGFSHGAALTNWIVTHDHRFRVGASLEGWADNTLAYGTGQRIGGNPALDWLFGAPPWQRPEAYARGEAIRAVKGVRTPMLFMSAERGLPAFPNEYLYTAWLRQGVDVQLLKYAGEGHVVSSDPNRRDLLQRVTDWFDQHLQ